jgi:FkbM family methyltransferase
VTLAGVIDWDQTRSIYNMATSLMSDDLDVSLPVYVGICNPIADIRRVVESLSNRGFSSIHLPPSFKTHLKLESTSLKAFWFDINFNYKLEIESNLDFVLDKLDDEYSRQLFISTCEYRQSGDYQKLMTPIDASSQYFPDFEFWTGVRAFADVGAYDGDTIRALISHGVVPETYIGFEPDKFNFLSATQALYDSGLVGLMLPLGVGNENEFIRFESTGGSDATISPMGNSQIQVVSIDGTLANAGISHIKMDIEGAEAQAIRGMRNLIMNQRPKMAISAYHKPGDIWDLIRLIDSLGDYTYRLRCYGQQTFETVLYCLPK